MMPSITNAATTMMGITTAMAVVAPVPRPWEPFFTGTAVPVDPPDVVIDVCWLPLPFVAEGVTTIVVGGNEVAWLGVCVTTDVKTCVDVGTSAVLDIVTTGGGACAVGVVGAAGVVGVVGAAAVVVGVVAAVVGVVAGGGAAVVVGTVPPVVDMTTVNNQISLLDMGGIWRLCEKEKYKLRAHL
jgi:hypothetical protein